MELICGLRHMAHNRVFIFILVMGMSMLGFGKGKSVIEVKFYEGKSEVPFAVSNVPIEQLPDTFENIVLSAIVGYYDPERPSQLFMLEEWL